MYSYFQGNFVGDNITRLLRYDSVALTIELSSIDLLRIQWTAVGNTQTYGNLADGRPIWIGDFTGNGSADVLFYYPGDSNWWLGQYDASTAQFDWSIVSNTAVQFGSMAGRPIWIGDFTGGGSADVLFYYPGDSNWWLAQYDASTSQFAWSLVCNTARFGNLSDGRPFWIGNFSGSSGSDVMFFNPADGSFWLAEGNPGFAEDPPNGELVWTNVANSNTSPALGELGPTFFLGDFAGFAYDSLLFPVQATGNWYYAQVSQSNVLVITPLTLTNPAGCPPVGQLVYVGDFLNNGTDSLLYYNQANNLWWIGRLLSGATLAWASVTPNAG